MGNNNHSVCCPECGEPYDLYEFDLKELCKDGELIIECPACLDIFRIALSLSLNSLSSLVVKRRDDD